MRTELLPVACRLSSDFLRNVVAQNLLRNRTLLRTAVQNFGAPLNESMNRAFASAEPFVTPLYGLALTRFDWNGDADYLYVNRPGLLTTHTYFARNGSKTLVRSATDIVANPIGVSLVVTDAFALRMAQGVLDSNLEAYLLSDPTRFDSAADAFASPHPMGGSSAR